MYTTINGELMESYQGEATDLFYVADNEAGEYVEFLQVIDETTELEIIIERRDWINGW